MLIIAVPVAIYRTGRKQRAIVVNSLTLFLPSQVPCPLIVADFISRRRWNPFHTNSMTSQSIPAQYNFSLGLECHPGNDAFWYMVANKQELFSINAHISLGNIQGATLPLQAIGPIRSSAEQQRIARSLVVFRSSSSPLVSIQPFH